MGLIGKLISKLTGSKTPHRPHFDTIEAWQAAGSPMPPPHIVKQGVIKDVQKETGITVLVETGTNLGAMVEAQKSRFEKVYSIELADVLYERAVERFKQDANVEIVHGDSSIMLPKVIQSIDQRIIFWLDGHYSGGETAKGAKDCPVYEELDAIFNDNAESHVILIDDARLFGQRSDYPSIEDLRTYLKGKSPDYSLEVKDDVIRCMPS